MRRSLCGFVVVLASFVVVSSCTGSPVNESDVGDGGIATGVVASALSSAPDPQCAVATFQGHEYWFCRQLRTWSAARTRCQTQSGMDLARIDSAAENAFIFANTPIDAWIGASDTTTEGAWRWSNNNDQFWNGAANGSVVGGRYANWKPAQPDNWLNQDCGAMELLASGKWADRACTETLEFVCERALATGEAEVDCTATGGVANSAWPSFRRCATHQGRSTLIGPPDSETVDEHLTGGDIESSPAIGADGMIYVGSYDGYLYAIRPDMTRAWRYQTLGAIRSSPAIATDGTIYVGSNDGRVYAINPNGTLKWSYQTLSPVRSSPAIGPDGRIYVGSDNSRFYALNATGTKAWDISTSAAVRSSAAISPDGTIYIGFEDWRVVALNSNGTTKWSYATLGPVTSSPAIGPDGTIYVGCYDGKLYAIHPGSGTLKWSVNVSSPITSSPAVLANGTIIFANENGSVRAVNPDGTARWSYQTGARILSSPVVGADGVVYIGSDDNFLYALDGMTGVVVWTFGADGDIVSSPSIGPNGSLYVGSYDDKLYAIRSGGCFGLTGLDPDSPWPLGRQCPQNRGTSDTAIDNPAVRWEVDLGGSSPATPVIDGDGNFYLGNDTGTFFSVRPNGTIRWQFETGGSIVGSAGLGASGHVYFGSADGYFYALDADTGVEAWRYNAAGAIESSPLIGPDESIYFGTLGSRLIALNGLTGAVRWNVPVFGAVRYAVALGAGGEVYAAAGNEVVAALPTPNLVPYIVRRNFQVPVIAAPTVSPDGSIYALTNTTYFQLAPTSLAVRRSRVFGITGPGEPPPVIVPTGATTTDNKWTSAQSGNGYHVMTSDHAVMILNDLSFRIEVEFRFPEWVQRYPIRHDNQIYVISELGLHTLGFDYTKITDYTWGPADPRPYQHGGFAIGTSDVYVGTPTGVVNLEGCHGDNECPSCALAGGCCAAGRCNDCVPSCPAGSCGTEPICGTLCQICDEGQLGCTRDSDCGNGAECVIAGGQGRCTSCADGDCQRGQGCDENADCALGLICGDENDEAFGGSGEGDVCWDFQCESEADALCGNYLDECGLCGGDACVPSCDGRICGSNGCSGTCGAGDCAASLPPYWQEREDELLPDAETVALGPMDGQFDVSPSGEATYTVPLTLPPGINGMRPDLSLTYRSSRGASILGKGWRIEGLSRIHRCNQVRPRDDGSSVAGAYRGVPDEAFCLDGERLIRHESQLVGSRVTERYTMERDTFVDLVFNRDLSNYADSFWTMKTTDGRLVQYGDPGIMAGPNDGKLWAKPGEGADAACTGDCAEQIHDWAIVKSTDRYDNTITYTYTQKVTEHETAQAAIFECDNNAYPCVDRVDGDSGKFRILQRYPKTIQWTGTPQHAGIYNVEFVYSDTHGSTGNIYGFDNFGDEPTTTENNFLVGVTQLLSEVRIRRHDQRIRSYLLSYHGGVVGNTLASVTECAMDGLGDYQLDEGPSLNAHRGVCKQPTEFWYTRDETFHEQPVTVQSNPVFEDQSDPMVIELDGRPGRELAYTRRTQSGGLFLSLVTDLDGTPDVINTNTAGAKAQFIDYNDDGRSDLVLSAVETGPGDSTGLIVNMSVEDGSGGYTYEPIPADPDDYPSNIQVLVEAPYFSLDWHGLEFVDINGDNKEDILVCGDTQANGEGYWQIRYWSLAGFGEPHTTEFPCLRTEVAELGIRPRPLILDVTDDGIPEWIWTYGFIGGPTSGIYVLSSWEGVTSYGLFREVWNERDPMEEEDYATGIVDLRAGRAGDSGNGSPIHAYKTGDFNGDGRTDIISLHLSGISNYARPRIFLNTGKGLAQPYFAFADDDDSALVAEQFEVMTVVDWNMDGLDDVLIPWNAGWLWYQSDAFQLNVREPIGNTLPVAVEPAVIDRPALYPVSDPNRDGICGALVPGWGCISFPGHLSDRYAPITIADFTGEGLYDVLYYDQGDNDIRVIRRTGVQPNLLQTIEENASSEDAGPEHDGRLVTRIEYTTTNDRDVHTPASFCDAGNSLGCNGGDCINGDSEADLHWPVECVESAIPVVKRSATYNGVEEDSPIDADTETFYEYSGGLVDRLGAGWLGFKTFRKITPARGVEETFTFDNETRWRSTYPFLGMAQSIFTVRSGVDVFSELIENVHDVRHRDATTFFPVTTKQIATVVEEPEVPGVSIQKVTTTFGYDGFGNKTHVEVLRQAGGRTSCSSPPCSGDDLSDTTFVDSITTDATFDNVTGERNFIGLMGTREIASCVPDIDAVDDCEALGGLGSCDTICESRNTSYVYNVSGRHDLFSVTEGAGQADSAVATFLRDDRGNVSLQNVTSKGETRATLTVYEGDQMFPTWVVNPEGHEMRFAYHPKHGYVIAESDANEVSTFYSYDGFGRIAQVSRPEHGYLETYAWAEGDDYPVLTKQIAGGALTVDEFDHRGRPVRILTSRLNGEQSLVEQHYNSRGLLERVSQPYEPGTAPVFTELEYDARERVVRTEKPDGAVETVDFEGLWIHSTDGLQHTLSTRLNRRGQVAETLDPPDLDGVRARTRYAYGPFGHLVRIIDHEGNETSIERDRLGRAETVIDPNRGTSILTYNGFGDLETEIRRANGSSTNLQSTSWTYDKLGRQQTRTDADGTTVYEWDTAADGVGELASVTSADELVTRTYFYDEAGRLERTHYEIDGSSFDTRVTEHDEFGNVTRLRLPNGPGGRPFEVRYDYDGYGNVDQVWSNTSSGFLRVWEARGSDAYGNLTQEWNRNDVITDRTYDVLGRPETIRASRFGTEHQDVEYKFDHAGNLEYRLNNDRSPVRREDFDYDGLNRLVTAWITDADGSTSIGKTYTYSPTGRMTFQTGVGAYHYDNPALPHAVTSAGLGYPMGSLVYDSLGKLVERKGVDIEYTGADRVRRLSGATDDINYLYDGFDQRVRKEAANGDVTYYVDGLYTLFVPANGSAPEHRYLVSNGQRAVARVEWRTDAQNADVIEYLHDDYLGSTELITSSAGSARKRMSYEAFGSVRHTDWMSADDLGEYNEVGFAGHRHDEDALADVIDMGARLYDPVLARFLQPDPMTGSLGYSQDLDRYSYAFNRPLTFVDPTGLDESGIGATATIPKPDKGDQDRSRLPSGGFLVTYPVSNGEWGDGYTLPDTGRGPARQVRVHGYISGPASTTDGSGSVRDGDSKGAAPEDPLQRQSGGGGGSSISEMIRASEAFGKLLQDTLMPAADWMEANAIGDRAAGFGDNLSFGITGAIRSWTGTGDTVNENSDAYGSGETAGTVFSLGFGVVQLGKSAAAAGWRALNSRYAWSAVRNRLGKQLSLPPGTPIHHWLIPQGGTGQLTLRGFFKEQWGRFVPNVIKNSRWNLMVPPQGYRGAYWGTKWHQGLHGTGDFALGLFGRLWHGSPSWAKAVAAGGAVGAGYFFDD